MAIFPQGYTRTLERARRVRDGGAEVRVLEQLHRCLEDDYLVWHNVAVGPKQREPDIVILHPSRGLLVLEVKGWKLQHMLRATPSQVTLNRESGQRELPHPLQQARGYITELVSFMQDDPGLQQQEGSHAGNFILPWGYGCVMAQVERAQITDPRWDTLFPPHLTLTKEDLADDLDPAAFQERLWGMFSVHFPHTLTLPQRDRIRWHLFPELRMPTQAGLFIVDDAQPELPPAEALLQVMDLHQEQLARSLGEGHRVVHGVAGSGKSMILIYRAQQLADAARPDRPVLVLCYNKALSVRLEAVLRQRGVDERVQVRTFHSWCFDMARSYQVDIARLPNGKPDYDGLAARIVEAVDRGRIPKGQYAALLIDEAHDFDDAWLRLAPQLVDPNTQSLLVLYDDAQSIYRKPRRNFSFASVGIRAQGRTSVLKVNYRNTSEVLQLATRTAGDLLAGRNPQQEDDDIAHMHPIAGGRHGDPPLLLRCQSAQEEADEVAQRVMAALERGISPESIGIIARNRYLLDPIEAALKRRKVITQRLKEAREWAPDSVKLASLHACKGLEFHTAIVIGLQALPDARAEPEEEWRLLYVAMTRATHELLLSASGDSLAVQRVSEALGGACTAQTDKRQAA